jgi:hypothetical protein
MCYPSTILIFEKRKWIFVNLYSCILSLNRKCFHYYSNRECDEFSVIFVLEKFFSFFGNHMSYCEIH